MNVHPCYRLALEAVNIAFARLTVAASCRVALVDDHALNAALRSGDQDRITAEVREWKRQQLAAIAAVTR